MQQHLTVIVYDISCDQRRGKVHALLKQYGIAVQKSVFEARLTRPERRRLLERALKLIDGKVDSIILYPVPDGLVARIETVGIPRQHAEVAAFYVI